MYSPGQSEDTCARAHANHAASAPTPAATATARPRRALGVHACRLKASVATPAASSDTPADRIVTAAAMKIARPITSPGDAREEDCSFAASSSATELTKKYGRSDQTWRVAMLKKCGDEASHRQATDATAQ